MRPQPLICVHDVEASSRWYQALLGCQSAHGGKEYERLEAGGRLILQLHNWEVQHDHERIGDPEIKPYGNGVLLWFEIDDFDAAVATRTQPTAQPWVNGKAHQGVPAGTKEGAGLSEIFAGDTPRL